MSTSPQELNPEQRHKIVQFLASHPVGVLATVSEDGKPDASPVYFGVNEDLVVSFTTKRDTAKHANIARSGNIMLVAYDAGSQASVQISGKATEVTDPEAAQQIYRNTLRAASETGPDNVPPVAKLAAGPYVTYTVQAEDVRMNEYGRGSSFANAMKHAAGSDPAAGDDPGDELGDDPL